MTKEEVWKDIPGYEAPDVHSRATRTPTDTTINIRLMKFYLFMKYWSLAWMAASIGAAVGCVARKDCLFAIYYVISCAINHFCYNVWSSRSKT